MLYEVITRLKLSQSAFVDKFTQELADTLIPHRGGVCPVHVVYRREGAQGQLTLGTEWCVTPTDQLLNALRALTGKQSVELLFE